MIEQVQYKNFEITLNAQIKSDMLCCLENSNGIDIIAYILKMSQQFGYTVDRFNRVNCLIRNLFFAMNPAHNEYEKVRLFFEYSNCITHELPIETFNELEMIIYTILTLLRNVFYQDEQN